MCPPGHQPVTEEECKIMFDIIDHDGNRVISRGEMVQFIKECLDEDEIENMEFKHQNGN